MSGLPTCFIGRHNFTNFARVRDKNPWRNILEIRIGENKDFVYLEVKAESFLWHQVRCMASALFQVGEGEADETVISRLCWKGKQKDPFSQPLPRD